MYSESIWIRMWYRVADFFIILRWRGHVPALSPEDDEFLRTYMEAAKRAAVRRSAAVGDGPDPFRHPEDY
jgi:hypothetical protein